MRVSHLFVAALFSLTAACGGAIADDPSDGGAPPSDTAPLETDPDTMPPGACGVGACSPGVSCFDGCNHCFCEPSGGWMCTGRTCEDTGVPPTDAPPIRCPDAVPAGGAPCPATLDCAYANACGGFDRATCAYAGGRWSVAVADCPTPPPLPTCPTSAPKAGSACSGFLGCGWNNGCGGIIDGFCDGARWSLSDPGCTPDCPSAKPSSGAGCKAVSGTMCTYATPSTPTGYCMSQCFCAEDARWACIPGGCTSSGGGPAFDAGSSEVY